MERKKEDKGHYIIRHKTGYTVYGSLEEAYEGAIEKDNRNYEFNSVVADKFNKDISTPDEVEIEREYDGKIIDRKELDKKTKNWARVDIDSEYEYGKKVYSVKFQGKDGKWVEDGSEVSTDRLREEAKLYENKDDARENGWEVARLVFVD